MQRSEQEERPGGEPQPHASPTTWRLRATVGSGWVEAVVAGKPIITGDPQRAHQFPTRVAAEQAAEGFAPGLVPVEPVEGRPFDRAAPRQ